MNKVLLQILLISICTDCLGQSVYSSLFNYQRKKVSFIVDSSFFKNGINVQSITYQSTDSFVVSAFIVYPASYSKQNPTVIFQHWGEGNKTEFLDEALIYARNGVVCLLTDAVWLCPKSRYTSFKKDWPSLVRQGVMNVRVGIDLLETHFNMDTNKIFFVGHSYGAGVAGILSGIEFRIKEFVFMAGLYSATKSAISSNREDFKEWKNKEPESFKKWIKKSSPYDAELYLPFIKAESLIQIANKDEYITAEENELFAGKIPQQKMVIKYDSGHDLKNEKAISDRINWIKSRIKNTK